MKIDRDGPLFQNAIALAAADRKLKEDLIKARKDAGLSVEEIANRLGTSLEYVNELEAYWYDPNLSELRRYSLAIGVTVEHRVKTFRKIDAD